MIGRRLSRGGRPGLIGTAARTAVVAGTATAVSGRVAARHQQATAAAQPAPPTPAPPTPAAQPASSAAPAPEAATGTGLDEQAIAQLERLAALRAQNMLTEDEFNAAKQRILSP